MRFFRWNSFSIMGLILVGVGLYGLIKRPGFEFDAGLPSEPFEGFYYLLVGALMIVNGLIMPRPLPDSSADESNAASKTASAAAGSASAPARTK